MKNRLKLMVVSAFALLGLLLALASDEPSSAQRSTATPTPTPAARNTNAAPPANVATNANSSRAAAGDRKMRDEFILSQDSPDPDGAPVPFNHKTHAFSKYSPDGNSVIACVECHHTDQPKSALKLPLITGERDVVMTFDVWKASDWRVKDCKECHFKPDDIPAGKTQASYQKGGQTVDLDNKIAYHINCNDCHDAAAKLRPSLKGKPGFATGADCATCHSG